MACGRPVVATPESLAGLATQGRTVAVEARREEFLEGLAHVLGSASRSMRLAERGTAHVEAFHDWDRIASLMLHVLAEVAGADASTSSACHIPTPCHRRSIQHPEPVEGRAAFSSVVVPEALA